MATVEKPDTAGIPWTERDRRIWAEIDWAEQNARALSAYYGQWVAIHDRKIVAHGDDRDQVLRDAVQATGLCEDDVAVWTIADPDVIFLADISPDHYEF